MQPDAPNVARHSYPLMEVDREALARTKQAWVGRLTLASRPLTAVFVGGPTGGLRFGREEAAALAAAGLPEIHDRVNALSLLRRLLAAST